MLLVAGGFGTFMLFVLLGLLTLLVTAALDKSIGKEAGLLVWAVALLAVTWVMLRDRAADPGRAAPQSDKVLAAVAGGSRVEGDLLGRPSFVAEAGAERRNGFARFSDTRPLPPVEVEVPPELPLEFPLPPPIPGPAPGAQRLLRGTLPALSEGDASSLPELAAVQFSEYRPVPADVFDWFDLPNGARNYVAIVALNGLRPSDPGYAALERQLVSGEGADRLEVEWANIGSEAAASKVLDAASAARVSKQNRTTEKASVRGVWHVRRSVQNELEDQLAQHLPGETVESTQNVAGLLRAAERLEELGRVGKEGREGWKRAVVLLERALAVAQTTMPPERQADILVRVVGAYKALNDEQAVLRALTAYAKAAPLSPQPAIWTGELVLHNLGLAAEALVWFRKARAVDGASEAAALGEGDALTALGRHREALAAYERAGAGFEAQVRRAEAALRAADLARAQSAADAALGLQPEAPRALIARGSVLYVKGDLAGARSAYAMAAASTAQNGLWRAQALYDLGLTCWRLQETRAAVAAFDACDVALRMGSQASRFADETVSPSLGRALVAYALRAPEAAPEGPAPGGDAPPAPAAAPLTVRREGLGEYLAAARDEARRSSYREQFAGVLASEQRNVAAAIRSLRRALALAPDATELDGWLALNHLRWALVRGTRPAGGTPGEGGRDAEEQSLEALLEQPAADHFEAALAFAARASQNDLVDPAAFHAQLRETWVTLQAEHLTPRRRFEAAVAAADRVLNRSDLREQPAARAMRAYARYRLGGDPTDPGPDNNYNRCQNDLDLVLDKVADKDGVPWIEWRRYAERIREKIKHWRSLEEKVVSFEGLTQLTKDWQSVAKGSGVEVSPENGVLMFRGTATKDGTALEPLMALLNWTFFEKNTFESLSLRIRIPTTDEGGNAINNIVFGVGVQGQTAVSGAAPGGLPPRHPGLSIFYDKAKVAGRIGTGLDKAWKEGDVKRVRDEAGAERAWPAADWLEVRFVRKDAKEGRLAVYLGDDELPVLSDTVSGFRGVSGKAELWIGGWAQQAQRFEVYVKDIRIVRTRK